MIKTLTNNNEMEALKDIDLNGNKVSYDTKKEALKGLFNFINKNDVDIYDVESDGLNMVKDRDTLLEWLREAVKENIDEDPEDVASNPELQDLALLGRDDSDYFYINGYARVVPVTAMDILDEYDDVKDFLKNN